jgi:shikimate kinase
LKNLILTVDFDIVNSVSRAGTRKDKKIMNTEKELDKMSDAELSQYRKDLYNKIKEIRLEENKRSIVEQIKHDRFMDKYKNHA